MNSAKKELIKKIYMAIQTGEIVSGNILLPERDLAEYFQVKRSFLRECLIALEALGVIDIRERQGMFVGGEGTENVLDSLNLLTVWPADAITQIFELRTIIEEPTAAFAALRRTDKDIEQMRGAIDVLADLKKTHSPEIGSLGAKYNTILHSAIVKAAHNPVLLRVYEGTTKLYTEAIYSMRGEHQAQLPYERWPDEVFGEHKALVDAIEQGDPERARRMAIVHLENSRDRIKSILPKSRKA